jgi:COP9 signalosome complex subunit 3
MDKIVSQIQVVCSGKATETDIKELYRFLVKNSEILRHNVSVLEEVLNIISPAIHTIGWVCLLGVRASVPSKLPDPGRFVTLVRTIIEQGNPLHIQIACTEFAFLVKKAGDLFADGGQPLVPVSFVSSALAKLKSRDGEITALHPYILKLLILAHNYKAALPYTSEEVVSVQDASETEALLSYYYYGGIVHAALRNTARAVSFFRSALSVAPATALSAIALEAYKKYIVVSLIADGVVAPLPHYTPSVVTRMLKTAAAPLVAVYMELATAYGTHDTAVVQACIAANAQVYAKDGNAGLVKRALGAMPRHAIRRCTKTYLTLSLERIAQIAGIPSAAAAGKMIVDMVNRGEVAACVNSAEGMVSFREDSQQTGQELTAQLNAQIAAAFRLDEKLKATDQDISLSPAFIQRTTFREKGAARPGGAGEAPEDSMHDLM